MLDRFLKQLGRQNESKGGADSLATREVSEIPVQPGGGSGSGEEQGPAGSEELRRHELKGATSVVFANSKGGVGKSTVAFMTCLNLAIEEPDSRIEFIDLDRQATTSESLHRFVNAKFSLVSDPEFILASGGPNNARIYQHLRADYVRSSESERRFVFFDTPAGTTPAEYSFMLDANYLFVPTSASDADLTATKKFLSRLFDPNPQINSGGKIEFLPTVVVIPNLLDDRSEILQIYRTLKEFPCYLGQPIFYSKVFRSTFSYGISDHNVVKLMQTTKEFGGWVVKIINDDGLTSIRPSSLRQI